MIERIENSEAVEKSDLIISCDVCDQIWKVPESFSPSETLFREEHETQTGHTPNEAIPAIEYFETGSWTEWTVTCETCDWRYTAESEHEADQVYSKHKLHTGHEADEISEQ